MMHFSLHTVHCNNGRVVITTVWLYQFYLWDPCCNDNIILHGIQSSCLCRVFMSLRLAITYYW